MRNSFKVAVWGVSISFGLAMTAAALPTAQAQSLRGSGSHITISPSGRTEIHASEGYVPMPTEQGFGQGQLVLRIYSGLDSRGVELLNSESEQLGIANVAPEVPFQLDAQQQNLFTELPETTAASAHSLLRGLE